MTGTKDHAKINFVQFAAIFFDLLDEIKDNRSRCFFSLLDVKGTGILDSMLLMQLFHNIDRNTLLGQEFLKIIREYKSKNILLTHGYRR